MALELRTGAAATGRAAAARLPSGKVVFVEDAAPEELVEAEVLEERSSFARARLLRVLEPSVHRREPFCELFGSCGGCVWQHLSYPRQLEEKRNLLLRAVQRSVPGAELAAFFPSPSERGCRFRARLHTDPRTGALGFFEEGSHRVAALARCPMLAPPLSELLEPLTRLLGGRSGLASLELNLATEGVLLAAELDGSPKLEPLAQPLAALPGVAGLVLRAGRQRAALGLQEGTLEVATGAGQFQTPVALGGFMQSNPGTNALLVGAVLEAVEEFSAPGASVAELFCGSGNFSVPLATRGHPVEAVELSGPSVEALERRILATGLPIKVHRGDASTLLPAPASLLLLDPPRTGALELCSHLDPSAFPALVYVSCDPWTLGRDLGVLVTRGYRLRRLQGFDMFPQTAHVEALAVLTGA